jgi:hypothetical protein
MISAEREQRDHQAVEKPLPVREEAFIQVARYYITLFFRRLSKAGFSMCTQAESFRDSPRVVIRYTIPG